MRTLSLSLCLAGLLLAQGGCAPPPPAADSASPKSPAASSAAPTGAAPGRAEAAFSYTLDGLDKNGDRRVSRAEFRAALERKFKEIDKDGSGRIEIRVECIEHLRAHCETADKGGDGHVDLAEFVAHGEAEFDRADVNKDGFLAPEEISALQIFGW
jgi:hypothetical protein